MAYSNAIFRIDLVNGSDAVRSTLTPSAYADNGSGSVRVTLTSNSLVTGGVVDIAGTTGSVYVGAWKVTVINATTLDLIGSTYTTNPATKGTVIPRGGDTWTNAWKTITSGATSARHQAGDTIQFSKSPAPYSLGINGTWTDHIYPPSGTKTITSSANSGGLIAMTVNGHGFTTGQVVYIEDHATGLNANGNWTITYVDANTFTLNNSTWKANGTGGKACLMDRQVVKLSGAKTATICRCEELWTVAGSSTITRDTTNYKCGDSAMSMVKSSPATSTLYGYFATGTLNLSAYQNITLWVRVATAIASAANWKICLCSDVAGTTIVDTFWLPVMPLTGYWTPLTIAKSGGGNLGSSIQSIAIYSGTSAATTTGIVLDNILACTSGGLNLQSLISKNTLEQSANTAVGYANEPWFVIKNISQDGLIVHLDNNTNCQPNNYYTQYGSGYSGVSETVALYARETFKWPFPSTTSTPSETVNANGSSGSLISYVGGYNTSTGNKDGETFFDNVNGSGYGIVAQGKKYLDFSYIAFIRCNYALYIYESSYISISFISNFTACLYGCWLSGAYFSNINILNICNNSIGFYYFLQKSTINLIGNICNNYYSFRAGGGKDTKIVRVNNIEGNYINITPFGGDVIIYYVVSMTKNSNGAIAYYGGRTIIYKIDTYANHSKHAEDYNYASTNYSGMLTLMNFGGLIKNYFNFAQLYQQNSTLANGSGKEWVVTVENAARNIENPIYFPIGKIAVASGSAVTVKLWVKKSHATNIVFQMICRAYQIEGVSSDQIVTKGNNTTEEEITLTISTPSEAGVIELECLAYLAAGSSESVIFDKLTVTQ